MDDDLTFGASVWATESTSYSTSGPLSLTSNFHSPTFDEFDDFENPAENIEHDLKDDDFGDFENFGEVDAGSSVSFAREGPFFEENRIPGHFSQNWRPLQLNPFPSKTSLEEEIGVTLAPIWNYQDIGDVATDEVIREVEGIAQILLTPKSREMYKMLLQTTPTAKPPNWTRSRIRRQHLITLGIPVNLDEVLPRANGNPLPTLEIHTRPMSAPPGNRNKQSNGAGASTNHNSRSGTPQPVPQGAQFGPKPELDIAKINKLLSLNNESLTMQPLVNLERYLAEIRLQTGNTSNLLTYLLQSRDALQQDSETYNGLIAEMVGEAQKLKSGKPRMGSIRRGNGV